MGPSVRPRRFAPSASRLGPRGSQWHGSVVSGVALVKRPRISTALPRHRGPPAGRGRDTAPLRPTANRLGLTAAVCWWEAHLGSPSGRPGTVRDREAGLGRPARGDLRGDKRRRTHRGKPLRWGGRAGGESKQNGIGLRSGHIQDAINGAIDRVSRTEAGSVTDSQEIPCAVQERNVSPRVGGDQGQAERETTMAMVQQVPGGRCGGGKGSELWRARVAPAAMGGAVPEPGASSASSR